MSMELQSFLDEKGRLTAFPSKRKKKLMALAYLAEKTPEERVYREGIQRTAQHTAYFSGSGDSPPGTLRPFSDQPERRRLRLLP